ncbi:MAG: BP74-related protein [Gemmatimonadaceae bacterium]
MKFVRQIALAAAFMAVAACGSDSTGVIPGIATFTVQVGSEEFAVRVVDQATLAKLNARMQSGTAGVILGRVAAGDGGFNSPWSWHLVPSSIEAPDVSIELCDGTPSYVEAQRDEWMRDVKQYCPWGAKVIAVQE